MLDGVNVASLAFISGVVWDLGQAAFVDPLTVVLAVVSLTVLLRYQVNTSWLIAGGALIGWFSMLPMMSGAK